MILRELFPIQQEVEITGLTSLRNRLSSKPWAGAVTANLVTNLAGEFTDGFNRSRGLSNAYDRENIIGVRASTDLILVSATTARAEQYTTSSLAPIMIASSTGDFENIPAVTEQAKERKVILVTKSRFKKEVAERYAFSWVHVVTPTLYTPKAITKIAMRLGYKKVLLEAGPTFVRWFCKSGQVSEIRLAAIDDTAADPKVLFEPALSRLTSRTVKLRWAEAVDTTTFSSWSVGRSR